MTPCRGNTILFRSSSNSLVSISDLWRAFWADTAPFKGPQPRRRARCFGITEKQGHHQVWRPRRGGSRTPSRTTDANLVVRLLKTHFCLLLWILGGPWPPPDLRKCYFYATFNHKTMFPYLWFCGQLHVGACDTTEQTALTPHSSNPWHGSAHLPSRQAVVGPQSLLKWQPSSHFLVSCEHIF